MTNHKQIENARKSPPIYVSAKLAGAIEHVTIGVTVNR